MLSCYEDKKKKKETPGAQLFVKMLLFFEGFALAVKMLLYNI